MNPSGRRDSMATGMVQPSTGNGVSRTRSLSRPERQRPRQGLLRSTTLNQYHRQGSRQAPGAIGQQQDPRSYGPGGAPSSSAQHPSIYGGGRGRGRAPPPPPVHQPLPDQLARQLSKQRKFLIRKQQHQYLRDENGQNAGTPGSSNPNLVSGRIDFDDKHSLHSEDTRNESDPRSRVRRGWWAWLAFVATCCIPSCCIRVVFGKSNPMMRQAWREKMTLVYIIVLMCLALAYITYGLTRTICPSDADYFPHSILLADGQRVLSDVGDSFNMVPIFGQLYDLDEVVAFFKQEPYNLTLTSNYYQGGVDLGAIFDGDLFNDCGGTPLDSAVTRPDPCQLPSLYGGPPLKLANDKCLSLSALQDQVMTQDSMTFQWDEFNDPMPYSNMVLLGNTVVNLTRYFHAYDKKTFGGNVDSVLHQAINRDASYGVMYNPNGDQVMDCLSARYGVGVMQTDSGGCIASTIVMDLFFAVIIVMITVRYLMALLFQWFISRRLVKKGGRSNWLFAWRSVQGGNNNPENHIPGPYNNYTLNSSAVSQNHPYGQGAASPASSAALPQRPLSMPYQYPRFPSPRQSSTSLNRLSRPNLPTFDSNSSLSAPRPPVTVSPPQPPLPSGASTSSSTSSAQEASTLGVHHSGIIESHALSPSITPVPSDIVQTELYTCMLVTCYSEGEEGLRITMDSLANTTYSNKHKIFFVVCDGLIVGSGESKSTPDIVVDMMDIDPAMADPKPVSYMAIADGEKQLNMAKVYAGHYNGVPCVTIVKCGTPEERDKPKPGNRGKRDSQLILMSFFQHILFNDRLSELDYEIFWKTQTLMNGVTPDKFELMLMVDADTKVLPDALTYMVAAMANDITIMGLCGETRIANKTASWVTAIQVFEYYINHHYAKAFESMFGIVTCLPGCFSMYRIKAPKNGAWVPILANPDVVLQYNENVVTTLHEKNLLLLGEDRFLSTLMLRTFPKRQMIFVPQAVCKTVVPDEFRVLLSQRRRWINSTVHNLMELVLVSDLCGIACLSMQFSVFIDLISTCVLPCAVIMTVYLIVSSAVSGNPQWQSIGLLVAILGLPGILIALTTFKIVYIMWMIIYIIAIPVWNFILPVYSFWHFDDFSWGATRVVAGEEKGSGTHGDSDGVFDSSRLVMKKWHEWEAQRTGKVQKRPYSMAPTMTGSSHTLLPPPMSPAQRL
ncbi:chitin synthase-domain-containing protein [Gongronella butleri]|nr:chitin synthase-domain-containing protein [Gongronella butleri]